MKSSCCEARPDRAKLILSIVSVLFSAALKALKEGFSRIEIGILFHKWADLYLNDLL